ncbi:MAG: endonuclease/exonuclease/phosphatase family protein [Planctomycetota bacterium]
MTTDHIAALALAIAAGSASAQFNPNAGQWGKDNPADLRVMSWNIQDSVVSTTDDKSQAAFGRWDAIARVLADLQPDILIIQEAGDRSGNGSGGGVDSVAQLERTFEQLIEGGLDEFDGNTPILRYVQLYAPTYDLPFKFASTSTDNFNRNVILSRFPFADLNGDCQAEDNDIIIFGDGGLGSGGIRGFATAEIDLPDDTYAHDVVIGNSHLKAGGSSSDASQRQSAAENIAAYIRNFFDGRLTDTPDPLSVIPGTNPQRVLINGTPVIWGGDWNEDFRSNGFPGAPETMIQGQSAGGTNGTDRDGSDATFDNATQFFSGNLGTRGGSKLDYIAYQDSQILGVRNAFVFNSSDSGINVANLPPAVAGFSPIGTITSSAAADHYPVVLDFILETVQPGQKSCDRVDTAAPFGVLDLLDIDAFIQNFTTQCSYGDLAAPFGIYDLSDIDVFIDRFLTGCPN